MLCKNANKKIPNHRELDITIAKLTAPDALVDTENIRG